MPVYKHTYDMDGNRRAQGVTDELGVFTIDASAEGCYYVATDSFPGLLRQIFDDRTCEPGDPCEPTTGDLVRACDDTSFIADFLLDEPVAVFSDGFESGDAMAWSVQVP